MNIFLLDNDPKLCARYHSDKHVVKMILEHAQMMSTALRVSGVDAGYKIAHLNHPCTKWVRASYDNYNWLYDLTFYLNLEYRYRFNHNYNHKSFDMIDAAPEPILPNIGLTAFAQAMPDEYKNENAVIAYRRYYVHEKAHLHSWTRKIGTDKEGNIIKENIGEPEWLNWYG